MPCRRPRKGYRSRIRNPDTGSRSIVFNVRDAYYDFHLNIPCGYCIDCRLKESMNKGIRCLHESYSHSQGCFVTLTYRPEDLPLGGTLEADAIPLFMKRLRKRLPRGHRISVMYCGEYGTRMGRPHYHLCIFGYDFSSDRYPWRITRKSDHQGFGYQCFRSPELESLWTFGNSEFGSLTLASAAYVGRYITKRKTLPRGEIPHPSDPNFVRELSKHQAYLRHYDSGVTDPLTGEVILRLPEFGRMSNRPAIGKEWLLKNYREVYPSDSIIIKGHEVKPPRYYDKLYAQIDPEGFKSVQRARRREGEKRAALLDSKNTRKYLDDSALRRGEEYKLLTLKDELRREYEDDDS